MWTHENSVETVAAPDVVFAVLRDVARWSEWNQGVERIDLDGPFATGTSGVMVIPGQAPLGFRLPWVGEDQGFEDETPLADMDVVVRVRHSLQPLASGGTRITYRATVEGRDAVTFGREIGLAVTADFPDVMAALARRAEARVSAA